MLLRESFYKDEIDSLYPCFTQRFSLKTVIYLLAQLLQNLTYFAFSPTNKRIIRRGGCTIQYE